MAIEDLDKLLDAHFGPALEKISPECKQDFVEAINVFNSDQFWSFLGRPRHRENASELEKCCDYLEKLNALRLENE